MASRTTTLLYRIETQDNGFVCRQHEARETAKLFIFYRPINHGSRRIRKEAINFLHADFFSTPRQAWEAARDKEAWQDAYCQDVPSYHQRMCRGMRYHARQERELFEAALYALADIATAPERINCVYLPFPADVWEHI